MNKIIFGLIIFLSVNVYSQVGPELPVCPDCNDIGLNSVPTSAIWWNPDQSGVGINISIQNNKVFGIYYGYSDDGDSTWYTFIGDLVASEQPGSNWELSAPLDLFENGTCINCDYQFPNPVEFNHEIFIRFNQANHASYSIDDGESQNIIPHLFAPQATTAFPEQTDIKIPDIDGYWAFSYITEPVHEFNPIQSAVTQLLPSYVNNNDDGTSNIRYYGVASDVLFPLLACHTYLDDDENVTGPKCVLFPGRTLNGAIDYSDGYLLNIGDIGTNKMIGKKPNGDIVEAYKLDYKPTNL